MPSLEKPSVFAFDWDGTLVDTTSLIVGAIEETCQHFHIMDVETFRPFFGVRAPKDYYPSLFGEHLEKATAYYYTIIEREHLKRLRIIEGALPLLDYLAHRNFPLFIVSNKRHDLLEKEIHHLKWTHYFKDWIGGGVLPKEKPAPDQLLHILSKYDLLAGPHVWFVGDTDVDERCAEAANCTSIIINNKIIRKSNKYSNRIIINISILQNLIHDII